MEISETAPATTASSSSSSGHYSAMLPVSDDEPEGVDADDCSGPLVPFKLPHPSSLPKTGGGKKMATNKLWIARDKKFRRLIREHDCEGVSKMLSRYPRLAWTSSYSGSCPEPALNKACHAGNLEIFRMIFRPLKERDPAILQNALFQSKETPLIHTAARSGNYEIFKTLVDDEHAPDMFKLDVASTKTETMSVGSCGCGKLTHDHSKPKTVSFQTIVHKPILHEAAQSGNLRIVAEVLSKPQCDINTECGQGMTALHWAIYDLFSTWSSGNKSLDIVAYLLARGADVNYRTKLEKPTSNWVDFRKTFGMSPLHFALAYDPDRGADLNRFVKQPHLPQLIRLLLAHGAQVDIASTSYQTRDFRSEITIPSVPLIQNAQALGLECFAMVLGENMLHLAGPTWTPLHLLCSQPDVRISSFAVVGAQLDQWLSVSHEAFGTPLHIAVRLQRLLLVDWLLPRWTLPIDTALLKLALPEKCKSTNIFDMLFERYALPADAQEREEALHDLLLSAVNARSKRVVGRLLHLGADPTMKDFCAIVAAWQSRDLDILRSLVLRCSKEQVNAAFPLAVKSRAHFRLVDSPTKSSMSLSCAVATKSSSRAVSTGSSRASSSASFSRTSRS